MIDWANLSLQDLAGIVSEALKKNGIDTVLVGGACVTIYSENRYQSHDLDYVTYDDMRRVTKTLEQLSFIRKGKYFEREGCPWFVEFVSPPVAVGNEPIREFNLIETAWGTVKLLFPTDSVKDRLASFYYWRDRQALEQAVEICLSQVVNIAEVKRWSIQEGQKEKLDQFMKRLNERKRER